MNASDQFFWELYRWVSPAPSREPIDFVQEPLQAFGTHMVAEIPFFVVMMALPEMI